MMELGVVGFILMLTLDDSVNLVGDEYRGWGEFSVRLGFNIAV